MSAVASDERAIANLIFAYAERVDAGDFEGLARLLAHAVVTSEGTPLRAEGHEAVLQLYRATTRIHTPPGTPRTAHLTTNLLIELGPGSDEARCRSRFTVLQQTPSLPLQPIVVGRYHDRFERVAGDWRFAARHMFVDFVGEIGEHLLIGREALPAE